MKKTLTVFLLVCAALAVAYGAASYWLGGQARRQHDQMIAQINRSSYLEASTKSYERGLFSSRALITITLIQPERGDSIRLSIINSIYHGPFVFLEDRHLKGGLRFVLAVIRTRPAPGDSDAVVKKMLEGSPELESLEILTVLYHDGSGESYLDVPTFRRAFSNDEGRQFEVEWGGLSAKFKFDAQMGEITASCGCPSVQVAEQSQRLRIKDIRGDMVSHPGIKGVSVGSTDFSIGTIEGTGKDNSSFKLMSLRLRGESEVAGETINGSFRLGFDKLDADGLALGPFAVEFEARKLDAEVLSHFQKLVPEMRKKALEKTESAKAAIETLFTGVMIDLLAKSPEFEIKQLTISTDKGDLRGRARLGFAGGGKNRGGNILALIAGIEASAELTVSEALFFLIAENALREGGSARDPESAKASARAIANGLLEAKYMISENGSFKSSATYKHGIVTVNGRKLDLSSLP